MGGTAVDIEVITHKLAHAKKREAAALLATSENVVAIVALGGVDQVVLLATPEALDLDRSLDLATDVGTPRALDTGGHGVPVAIALAFEVEEGLGVFDKRLGDTHLPLVLGDACIGKDANVFLETKVLDLVENRLVVILLGRPVLVGLDGTDVVGLALHEVGDEVVGGCLNLVTSSRGTLLGVVVDLVGEEGAEEWVCASLNEVENVLAQLVLVLVGHTRDVVKHITGVVLDQELVAARLKVRVGSEHARALDERVVGRRRVGVGSSGGIVEGGKDTGRALAFDKLTHNGIVKD
jgi:hypothetical protein